MTWRLRREAPSLPETLRELADLALLRGSDAERASLSHASEILARQDTADARRRTIRAVLEDETAHSGFDQTARHAVSRIVEEGRDAVLSYARSRLAPDVARLLAIPGVTLSDVVAVHRRTGAVTAGDLAFAVGTLGHPAADIDDTLRARLEAALPSIRAGHPRVPLGRAVSIYERLHAALQAHDTALVLEPVGSLRRYEPTVGDVEFLVSTANSGAAFGKILAALEPSIVLHHGANVLCLVYDNQPVVFRSAAPAHYAFAQVYYTGSTAHVRNLQRRALDRGWRLTPHGFQPGPLLDSPSEAAIYDALDVAYAVAERRGADPLRPRTEPEPRLIAREDIRGDLHVHTLWSDGRDSVESMVRTAQRLGYEYVAITDHSQRAAASRVLTIERLERQLDEIERVQSRVAIRVLRGAEVDILPDGSLDFPDWLLERLDIVLASLHDPAGQPPDRLLQRYLSAMAHPRVNIITHPANRLVGRDDGYALDFDALFEAAVRTGTVLEVDGGPAHLDMDGALARRAVAAGVIVSVDSDCHNAERLERQMALGIGTARRGALEPRHVLNTRPLEEVFAFFAQKATRVDESGSTGSA
ncbi:MAG: PHP domain-containing protein [Vicinamibacterales bacterium]